MKLIPAFIAPSTKSPAEKRLFEALKNSKIDDTFICMHSVNLPEHQYKVSGELDFVLISSRGIYIIEVKGGNVACGKDGIWQYTDRWGKQHPSSEGPFKQAQSGMFSLRKRLTDRLPDKIISNFVFGYGVSFPDCNFAQTSIEWDQQIVLDAKRLSQRGIEEYITSLATYWHSKIGHKPKSTSISDVKTVVNEIRPSFEMAYSLHMQANDIDAKLTALTEEQYSRLDIMEDSPRLLIKGGAGTGKTFLAMEIANRHAARNEKTLLICFSPILANFIRKTVSNQLVHVFSVHGIMLDMIKKHGTLPADYFPGRDLTDPWFTDVLTPAFEIATRKIDVKEKYSVLVIDEGQDILNIEYMTALDNILDGGLQKGIWRIFYDPYNQGAIFGSLDEDVLDWLKESGPAIPRLQINCRNTDPIVLKTKLMTGADMATKSTGPGPEVDINWYGNKQECAELLEKYIGYLEDQGVDEGEITILSPVRFNESCASLLSPKNKKRIKQLNGNISDTFPFSKITFSQIADFKGLENRYVLVIDFDDIDSTERINALLYVAMTRARAKLWIAINEKNKTNYEQKYLENLTVLSGNKL